METARALASKLGEIMVAGLRRVSSIAVGLLLFACAAGPSAKDPSATGAETPAATPKPPVDCAAWSEHQVSCQRAADVASAREECAVVEQCLAKTLNLAAFDAWSACERSGPCDTDCIQAAPKELSTPPALERIAARCSARQEQCRALPCALVEGAELRAFDDALFAPIAACLDEKDCSKASTCFEEALGTTLDALVSCQTATLPSAATTPAAIDQKARFGGLEIGRDLGDVGELGPPKKTKDGDAYTTSEPTSFAGMAWQTTLVFQKKKLEQLRLESDDTGACSRVSTALTKTFGVPVSDGDKTSRKKRPPPKKLARTDWRGEQLGVGFAPSSKGCSITVRRLTAAERRANARR